MDHEADHKLVPPQKVEREDRSGDVSRELHRVGLGGGGFCPLGSLVISRTEDRFRRLTQEPVHTTACAWSDLGWIHRPPDSTVAPVINCFVHPIHHWSRSLRPARSRKGLTRALYYTQPYLSFLLAPRLASTEQRIIVSILVDGSGGCWIKRYRGMSPVILRFDIDAGTGLGARRLKMSKGILGKRLETGQIG